MTQVQVFQSVEEHNILIKKKIIYSTKTQNNILLEFKFNNSKVEIQSNPSQTCMLIDWWN